MILQMCNDVPHGQKIYPCFTIFNSTADSPKDSGNSTQGQLRTLDNWESGMEMTTVFDTNNEPIAVTLGSDDNTSITLSKQCVQDLAYTSQM